MGKLKSFVLNKKEYLIVCGIIFLLITILYAIFGFFPFGSKSIATGDAAAQIGAFTNLIYDFFEGKAPLFYTQKIALGANTFSYLSYIFFSPLTFLLFIFGKNGTLYAYNIVFLIKLLIIGIVICLFLKKFYKKLPSFYVILFSLMYIFCGYLLSITSFIPWLDYFIYTPLLAFAFAHMLKTGKIYFLSIILSLFIITCYALGSFSFILIFLILGLYVFLVVPKEQKNKIFIKLILSFIISISVNLPNIIPSFLEHLQSSRNIGFFDFIIKNTYKIKTFVYMKIVTVTADIMLIFFSVLYLIKSDRKSKLYKFLLICSIIWLITVLFDSVIALIHGGSNLYFPLRFGFFNVFLLINMSSIFLSQKSEEYYTGKNNKFVLTLLSTITTFFVILLLVFLTLIFEKIGSALRSNVSTLLIMGLYLIFPLSLLFLMLFTYINYKKNNIKKSIFRIFFSIFSVFLIVCNLTFFLASNSSDYKLISEIQTLTQEVPENSRVKLFDFNASLDLNSNLYFGFSSSSGFSSQLNHKSLDVLKGLGYMTGFNTAYQYGATIFSDCLISNEFIIYEEEQNNPHLEFISKSENFYLYKNLLALNYSYIINTNDLYIDNSFNIFERQNQIFKQIFNTSEELINYFSFNFLSDEIEIEYSNVVFNIENNSFEIIDNNVDGFLKIKYTAKKDSFLYTHVETVTRDMLFKINSDDEKNYINSLGGWGFVEEGEELSIDLYLEKNVPVNTFDFAILDHELLINCINEIKENETNVEFLKNGFKVTANVLKDNSLLILPYVNLDGYTAFVNGEKVEIKEVLNGLISISLDSGEYEIIVEFNNPYNKIIFICFVIGILLVIICWLLNKFYNKTLIKLEKPVGVLYQVGMVIIVGFFFVFPIIISFLQLFRII